MNREKCCGSMPTSWDEASVVQNASSTNTAESHMLLSSRETRGKACVLWAAARASRSEAGPTTGLRPGTPSSTTGCLPPEPRASSATSAASGVGTLSG